MYAFSISISQSSGKDLDEQNHEIWYINTSYLTDSYIMFTLKMESVSKNKDKLQEWMEHCLTSVLKIWNQ